MKKLQFLDFLFFMVFFCTVDETAASAGNNTALDDRLSHDQYMVTYAGARIGDVIGVFDPWYPTQDNASEAFVFSLIDSKNGTYGIDNSSGLITLLNNTNLLAGTDRLVVRTTLGSKSEDHFVFVKVKETGSCYFIDPSAETNGNGTRDNPYNSWLNVTFKTGKAYFQKRGTTSTKAFVCNVSGTIGNEVILGSYGTGTRAEMSTGSTNAAISMQGSYIQFYELHFSNNLYGIETEAGVSPYQHCLFTDLSFDSNGKNGQLYFKRHGTIGENALYHRVFDMVASGGGEHGLKVEAGCNLVENLRAYNNYACGVSLPNWGSYDTLIGISTFNNGQSGIEISGQFQNLSYSSIKNEYRGIVIDDPYSYGSVIHHCLISGSTGAHGIFIRCSGDMNFKTGKASFGRNFIIEDNEIKNISGNNLAAIAIGYSVDNVIIRRNIMHDNATAIYIGVSHESIDSILIQHNILYSNSQNGIFGYAGDKIWIGNNTCVGTINLSGTTSEIVRNNYFTSLTSAAKADCNIDLDTISTERYFVDFANHDYHLKSTAVSAIDKGSTEGTGYDYNGQLLIGLPYMGVIIGQIRDFNKTEIINKADIGCYEYIPANKSIEDAEMIPAKLSLPDAAFYIQDNLKQDDIIGKVHADPLDEASVSYEIIGGNINQMGKINPTTGDLSVNNPSQLFLYDSLKLEIVAYNGNTLSNDTAVCILIISHPEPESEEVVNHSPIVSEQTFIVREENAANNMLIGTIKGYDIDNDQVLTYKIVSGNENNLFSIDLNTGNLYLTKSSSIDFSQQQQKILTISVTDNAPEPASSNTSVQISFVPMIKVFYIDPSVQENAFQNGSEVNPFNSWKDVPWMEGGIYKQKCGSVANEGKINVYASNVLITAYGEGDAPVINSSTHDFAIRMYEKKNITINGLHIVAENAISCIYIFGSDCDNNIIEYCTLEGSVNGVRVIDGKNVILRYNTFQGASEAIYSFAENTEIYYNVFKENTTGISVKSLIANCEVYNNVFYNNTTSISVSYSRLTVYNNVFYLEKYNAVAINKQKGSIISDYNLFYPDKAGFYVVAEKVFNSLEQLQNTQGFDLHSIQNDPAFRDVFNNNFKPAEGSPVINAGKFVGISFDFAGVNVSEGGSPDIGIFEYSPQTATAIETWGEEEADNEEVVSVFPNPSAGLVNVCFHAFDERECKVTISNLSGRILFTQMISDLYSGKTVSYDLSAYQPGIYFVELAKQDQEQSIVQKLILQ